MAGTKLPRQNRLPWPWGLTSYEPWVGRHLLHFEVIANISPWVRKYVDACWCQKRKAQKKVAGNLKRKNLESPTLTTECQLCQWQQGHGDVNSNGPLIYELAQTGWGVVVYNHLPTQNIAFSFMYYLNLCNAITIYCIFLPTKVTLVVWSL